MQLALTSLALSVTMSQLVNAWVILQMRMHRYTIMWQLLHEAETRARLAAQTHARGGT